MNTSSKSGQNSEAGFMLLFVVVLAALILIALAAAAPLVAKELQREKELESEHRAQQYVRAVRLYYRKNRTYPVSMDALENTNNIRFLRKQYVDPLTGKNDWRIIHVGENKTTVKGFFGQPLGGLDTTGAGGGLGSATSMLSGAGAPAGSTTPGAPGSTVSGGSALAGGFQGATIGGATGSSPAGGISSTSTSSLGSGGGVGQIMGVGTAKTGDSILNPNQQTTYESWEFIYDPKIELLYQKANLLGGPATINSQSPSSLTSPQTNAPAGSTTTPNTTPASSGPP